jgi:16S rRNA (cytidine1402-2'-O)-methyltransferase
MPADATLYVIGTPIGNLEDVSYRAVRVLGELSALACEDTRRTRQLLDRYEIPRPSTMFSLHEHNEDRAARRVLELLDAGTSVGMCSDAGMPLVSDPGFTTVRMAAEAGHRVEAIPGPTAVTSALAVSGLPVASFTFKGFPPRKPGPRRRFLEADAQAPHTLVLFESPHRLGALLQDAMDVLGDRQACVCVELTKLYEKVQRGFLSELCAVYRDAAPKGEVTVVIAGAHPKFQRERPPAAQDS